jgi:hypothetical protein
MRIPRALVGLILLAAVPAAAATFTVTNTADAGAGSLRQAILNANSSFGPDDIAFAIPAPGVQTITLASGLPPITEALYLDGFTQPGASANTQPVGQGLNAVLLIQIDGSGAVSEPCIQLFAGNDDILVTAILGLVINRCPIGAIHVGAGGSGALIAGNYLGTDPTGTSVPGPQGFGIRLSNVLHVAIGTAAAPDRNLISGHTDAGVVAQTAAFMAIRGNLIGTNAAGNASAAIDPFADGLRLDVTASVIVGGDGAGDPNVISGVGRHAVVVSNADASGSIIGNLIGTDVSGTQAIEGAVGVEVLNASPLIRDNVIAGQGNAGIRLEVSSSVIRGNFIGTDATATLALGNPGGGIYVRDGAGDVTIGGTGPGEANVIAHNGRMGLLSFVGGIHVRNAKTTIRANRIFDNRFLGIDLIDGRGGGFPTPNDPGDLDGGANDRQNFPMIEEVIGSPGSTQISGFLDSLPSSTFDLDFFSGPSCNVWPNGFLQGESYLGSEQVTTDGAGRADFQVTFPVELEPGESITATATDAAGHTSEFSQRMILAIDPRSGPSEGGATATMTGMDFGPSTEITVGGQPVTNISVIDYSQLTGTMPALPPGVVYDVVASNPPGAEYALPHGWLSDFLDVPESHPFHEYVVRLVTFAISAGVGGGNFGLNAPTTRQQMAVFLLKAKHGSCYLPPPCAGVFADVPCSSPFAPWIEQLAAEGITGGCGGGNFCPASPVRRDQMAPFLIKARAGADFVPPPCQGLFTDVLCPSLFADWIELLADAEITAGCGTNIYCPLSAVTRGQMAVFVIKTFFSFF